MVHVKSLTFAAVVVSSMLTLAMSNGTCNRFNFCTCCCEYYVKFSCEIMWLFFTLKSTGSTLL